MIIIFEGPEKAGKSTLIKELYAELLRSGYRAKIRKWGPAKIDDREYSGALLEDTLEPEVITLWDRAWVSEHVYAKLLGRDRRLANDPWLGEWLHRRAVDPYGLHYVVIPQNASAKELKARRDSTDLPVDPEVELAEFVLYATRFHWPIIQNGYTDFSLRRNISIIIDDITKCYQAGQLPPGYAGPPLKPDNRNAVFIEDFYTKALDEVPGAWLPFTDPKLIDFARKLGDEALGVGWAKAGVVNPRSMQWVQEIVTVGEPALLWVQENVKLHSWQTLTILPDPSLACVDYTIASWKFDLLRWW